MRGSSRRCGAQEKPRAAHAEECTSAGTTESSEGCAICRAAIPACTWSSRVGASCVEVAAKPSQAKRERLGWLADNPPYTKRFAWHIGRRCRHLTVRDVADEFHLDWHTVKALDKQYMQAQLVHAGTPAPRVLGSDEISVRKGHDYRIVVSDLLRMRPIWFGAQDRKDIPPKRFLEGHGPGMVVESVVSGSDSLREKIKVGSLRRQPAFDQATIKLTDIEDV